MDLLLGMLVLQSVDQVQFGADRPGVPGGDSSTARMILPVEPTTSA